MVPTKTRSKKLELQEKRHDRNRKAAAEHTLSLIENRETIGGERPENMKTTSQPYYTKDKKKL